MSEKQRATAAFRAKKFDVACPLFKNVVQKNIYDAWGWNDLALCGINAGTYADVLEQLDTGLALARSVKDEVLIKAVGVNVALFEAALLAHPSARNVNPSAKVLAAREYAANNHERALALFELAVSAATEIVEFSAEEWSHLGKARQEAGQFDSALDAFLRADDAASAAGLPSVLPSEIQGSAFPERCVELDPKNQCGRHWLACFAMPLPVEESSHERWSRSDAVIIRTEDLSKWKSDPTTEQPPKDQPPEGNPSCLHEGSSYVETRCAACVDGLRLGAHDADMKSVKLVRIDVCAGMALEVATNHQCEDNSATFTQRHIEPLALPR